MATKFTRCVFALSLSAMAAGAAEAQESSAVRGADPGVPVSIIFSDQQMRTNERMLTPQMMRQAQPMPMPKLSDEEFRRLFPEGGAPEPADRSAKGPAVTGNINAIPLRWAGKLFLQLTPTTAALCTAQFITPTMILTAGHCVSSGGKFLTTLTFRHKYQNGSYLQRNYPVRCVAGWPGWLAGGADKYRWDYAIIKVTVPSANGHMGTSRNWINSYRAWRAIGYPAALLGGQYIQVVSGQRGSATGGVVEMIHGAAGFTQGASGGAWIFRSGASDYAISVNSFITNIVGRVYGPYFDDNFITLFNYANRGCKAA